MIFYQLTAFYAESAMSDQEIKYIDQLGDQINLLHSQKLQQK
jgi:hypothetical protein